MVWIVGLEVRCGSPFSLYNNQGIACSNQSKLPTRGCLKCKSYTWSLKHVTCFSLLAESNAQLKEDFSTFWNQCNPPPFQGCHHRFPFWENIEPPGKPGPSIFQPNQPKRTPIAVTRLLRFSGTDFEPKSPPRRSAASPGTGRGP